MYDIDDGHVKIANNLLEDICRLPLSGASFRVIFWVIRNSYGYNRKNTKPATMAKMRRDLSIVSKGSMALALSTLVDNGILRKSDKNEYGINKEKVAKVQKTERLQPVAKVQKTEPQVQKTEPPIYIRRKDNLKTGEGEGRAPASAVLGCAHFPEKTILEVCEIYAKIRGLRLSNPAADLAFFKRRKVFFAAKDLLAQAQGNMETVKEVIGDLAKYYGEKPWTLGWVADDYKLWEKDKIDYDEKDV